MARTSPVPTYNIDFPDYEFREFPKTKYHREMEPVTVNDEYEETELGPEWVDTPFFPRTRYHRMHGRKRVMNSAELDALAADKDGWSDKPFFSPSIGKRPAPIGKDTDAEYAAFRAWRAAQLKQEAAAAGAEFNQQQTATILPISREEPKAEAASNDPIDAAERETLIGEAHLQGVQIDKRWSTKKIRDAIAAAAAGSGNKLLT